MLKPFITAGLLAALCAAPMAHALDWDEGKGQVHGFFAQGMVASSDNNFYGGSEDGGSWDFREIGLNASYRIRPGIQLSGQVISRRAGEMDTGALWVDYAFADITLLESPEKQVGVRIGRMKNPYGLYNETRDVAPTRPGVIVPQPIYFDIGRKFVLSGDGIHVYGRFQVPTGSMEATVGLAKLPINDRSSKATLVGYKAPGEFRQDRLTTGIQVMYETDDQRWLTGVSYFNLHQEYRPARGDAFPAGDVLLKPLVFSLRYSGEKWIFSSEYFLERAKFQLGGATQDNYVEGWYLQSQYRLKPDWELLLRYDYVTADKDDRDGKEFQASTGLPSFMRYTHDWVAGVRYDVTPNFMLRAEWHHVRGTFWLSRLDNPNPASLEKDWDMLMLLGAYHF